MNEPTIGDAARIISKIEACNSIGAKVVLLRNFVEIYASLERAGMREACAKAIENFKFLCEQNERAYASAKRLFSQAVWDILDLAADEAIERIKREARLEEATLWSRDKFTKTHSGYCDTLESHVKECLGCQRIAALTAAAKESK